ncbi:recombinase family protein [Clostridium sp. CX1]|uniref:recombinase family protein n=1 Tax=Clostridium sp. CX1 TaxID=2978346 RepID=UPI0021C0CFDA|nr:recombinase family protein [Clostridium sp. CX1]MCT8974975.1 recombinase family protein [Clostridium sp. CX1]
MRGKENSHSYKTQMKYLNNINVDKIFTEIHSGNIELNELIKYVRAGDIVFIYSIENISKNVKSIIRFIMQTQEKGVQLFIKTENLDTSNQFGKYILNIIAALDKVSGQSDKMERSETPNERGRIPRELAELRTYMKLVERNEISVKEACQKLNIGRTTYYRRIKQLENTIYEGIEGKDNEII